MLYDPSREFLPANALDGGRCPESIRDALIEVLRKFESGDVEEIHRAECGLLPGHISGYGFNMSVWSYCGTPMCIGGWIEHIGIGRLPHDWKICLPQLYALCHPWGEDAADRWDTLTLSQACRAIRHYLITGDGEHAWDNTG